MDKPVDMVAVGVGEHDLRDVVEVQVRLGHSARKFLLARHVHARERHVPHLRCLAGVYEPENSVAFDRLAVDRQRV